MSEIDASEGASVEAESPVPPIEPVKFPPFPDPSDKDFDEDLSEEEKTFYKSRFPDINAVVNVKLHCSACDRHLGCSARNESRMRPHPMLRTLICHTCHSFYNSGEFDKGEDGSELYCRWCGQGGQVYCCSDCIHVFCAKCIKRNLGISKIKEIENADDWKCFKCNPKCLWELRAICWALLRFCDIRNKIVHHTEDPELKDKYLKAISMDMSECCKNKGKRKEKTDSAKKKEKEIDLKKTLPKLPPTIQVKKFASINVEDTPKKPQKRSASPKVKMAPGFISKPIAIAPCTLPTPPLKKIRMSSAPVMNPIRMAMDNRKIHNTYTRVPVKPRQTFPIPVARNTFNGLQNPYSITMPNMINDNINLSLETLTQGLDMAAVAAFNNNASSNSMDDNVVCTPDFPLEPLCEVTEDNDDDVECITPAPPPPLPKLSNPPPLVARSLPDFCNDNIVQMTEDDVTVNSATGGLKFRVDPQTLSSKKMYRLPDGRIFAINPNPNMPGGYSATIVSVSETGGKTAAKGGETFAAKLSAVTSSPTPSSKPRIVNNSSRKTRGKAAPPPRTHRAKEVEEPRLSDFKVPVEWYRYNLIDAVDALDYSLSRLNKLRKEATTGYLRTRTVDEIKYLHRTLEQLLTTSSKRFVEIRDNLNKELKQFIAKKTRSNAGDVTEDDDDVEFLPNAGNEDPIFIDENSVDSVNVNDNQEVDLTGVGSSEHNDSSENKNESDPLLCNEESIVDDKDGNTSDSFKDCTRDAESPHPSGDDKRSDSTDKVNSKSEKRDDASKQNGNTDEDQDTDLDKTLDEINDDKDSDSNEKEDRRLNDKNNDDPKDDRDESTSDVEDDSGEVTTPDEKTAETNGDVEKEDGDMEVDHNGENGSKDVKAELNDTQTDDVDMSEEMIETLLKEELGGNELSNTSNMDILDDFGDKQ